MAFSFVCAFFAILKIFFLFPVVLLQTDNKLDCGEGILVKIHRKGKEPGLNPALKNEIKC